MVEAYINDPVNVVKIAQLISGGFYGPHNATRLCAEHHDSVQVRIEGKNLDKPGETVTQAVLTGCCKSAIDDEVKVLSNTLGWMEYLTSNNGKDL